jgi:uncharacterized protein YutE (UPF0331/DUF86 family)
MTDVALAKIATIQRCVRRIRDVVGASPSRVREIDIQDIVVLNLQRAIQAAVDLAALVIARRGDDLPDTLKAHFTILARAGVIDDALRARLEAMAGFRNIAVHDYQRLDVAVLERIVRERLGDLEALAAAATRALDE